MLGLKHEVKSTPRQMTFTKHKFLCTLGYKSFCSTFGWHSLMSSSSLWSILRVHFPSGWIWHFAVLFLIDGTLSPAAVSKPTQGKLYLSSFSSIFSWSKANRLCLLQIGPICVRFFWPDLNSHSQLLHTLLHLIMVGSVFSSLASSLILELRSTFSMI